MSLEQKLRYECSVLIKELKETKPTRAKMLELLLSNSTGWYAVKEVKEKLLKSLGRPGQE